MATRQRCFESYLFVTLKRVFAQTWPFPCKTKGKLVEKSQHPLTDSVENSRRVAVRRVSRVPTEREIEKITPGACVCMLAAISVQDIAETLYVHAYTLTDLVLRET